MKQAGKTCPECGHKFQGNGWDGIDAHWKAKHAHLIAYKKAWPLISAAEYRRKENVPNPRPNRAEIFAGLDGVGIPKDFLSSKERNQGPPQERDWFNEE